MAKSHSASFRHLANRILLGRGSMVRRSFLRFAARSLKALFLARDTSCAPVPALVLRVGMAGPIRLHAGANLEPVIDDVLMRLRDALALACESYRKSFNRTVECEPACRLITQLAAGADQLVTRRALRFGYSLECPVPVSIERYAEDLRRNPGFDADPAGELLRLSAHARVFELDGEDDPAGAKLDTRAYEYSAITLLDHSDILLALVQPDAASISGGTRWLVEQAEQRGMPVIEIVLGNPRRSHLQQGSAGARRQIYLVESEDWARALVDSIVLLPRNSPPLPESSWFEEKFRRQIKADESEWPPNWAAAESAAKADKQVRGWIHEVRSKYFAFWRWAEHGANTYRDLYQGAYITVSLLGLLAVLGALSGALYPPWSVSGKWLELVSLAGLLLLWRTAHRGNWRQRWIGYRALEQQISHAAVLGLVGRTIPSVSSPTLSEFQKKDAWLQWYLRAVLRQASLPKGRLDGSNLHQVGHMILAGKIDRQIQYYGYAAAKCHDANLILEGIGVGSLCVTLLTACIYLLAHYTEESLHLPVGPLRLLASGAGIFFPAMAATLAAIRAQAEFSQLEARYLGLLANLKGLRKEFVATLDAASRKPMPLLSARLALYATRAAAWMIEEVSHWHGLLQTHEIERG